MSDLLSHGAYARRKGFSQQYISQLVAKGTLSTVGGKIDPDVADRELAASSDPRMGAVKRSHDARRSRSDNPPAPKTETLPDLEADPFERMTQNAAQTAKLRIQAKRETLEYEKEIRKVVEVTAVQTAIADLVPNATTTIEAMPDRIAARLAAEPDVRKCRDILQAECDAIRQQLADFGRALVERLTASTQ